MELNNRINRIIGQLRGIEKMVEKKRNCTDILQQISAVKKAIDSLAKQVVVNDMRKWTPKSKLKKTEGMIDRLVSI